MELNKYIDHTLLKAFATEEDIRKLCNEAIEYDFASVCVNPCHVKFASQLLGLSDVKVCTVIGFPLGANSSDVKAFEAKKAIEDGAEEVDMVINVGKAKQGDWDFVRDDIRKVREAAKDKLLKVIVETCYLTDEEIFKACIMAKEAEADFVKTSTGFGTGGATAEHVKLMRDAVGEQMGVKASGGVRTKEDAMKMIDAGATRIGTSNGKDIIG